MRSHPESLKNVFETGKEEVAPEEVVPEEHWFELAKRLYEESGEIPDSLQIRGSAIVETFGIPSGQYSALELSPEKERVNKEKDRIIAEELTNKAGVFINKKRGIISSDFRDLYPEGLAQKLKEVLDPGTLAIMETEYKHSEYAEKRFEQTKDEFTADLPVYYFRLPGGIDVFLQGYSHHKQWQKEHGKFLQEINKHPAIICIEGFPEKHFGTSLDLYWNAPAAQHGDYDVLMHEAVGAGFNGIFTEIDARDVSKIQMDSIEVFGLRVFPELPFDFFEKYFNYLEKEQPGLTKIIGSPENLKQALIKQSTTGEGIYVRERRIYRQGKCYIGYPYLFKKGEVSFEPTSFLELGQHLFSDALAAVKLHLIAKLMSDGYIEKGPIIDYEGSGHLSSKSFFLRQPQYAMEVVLRTVNELMAGRVKEEGNIPEIYKVFENPDWPEIVKEIARLTFKEAEKDPSKPTAIGPNQRKLLDRKIDFLEIYDINPQKVIPTDEEIKKIQEKIGLSA